MLDFEGECRVRSRLFRLGVWRKQKWALVEFELWRVSKVFPEPIYLC